MAIGTKTPHAVLASRAEAEGGSQCAAPPHVLRCLVISFSAERRRLIRAAAEAQAWDAIICRDAGEFLRAAFKRCVPLIVIDLPRENSTDYWDIRQATNRAKEISQALLVVSGAGADHGEEVWARGLGVWGYLSEANSQRGFELVLGEARQAVKQNAAKQGPMEISANGER